MKNLVSFSLLMVLIMPHFLYAQNENVGINTNDPDPSALLELFSDDKGLLIPRLTSVERDLINAPANGLIIYNVTTKCVNYYVTSIGWKEFCGEDAAASCQDNGDCPAGYYCFKMPGMCNIPGVCKEKPTTCPDVWDPVCGCDGNTYGNACEAAAAGINVDFAGECTNTPCTDNGDCPAGFYCRKAIGDCAGQGECVSKPIACPDVWDPVCGCDNNTYGNACKAAAAGINIAADGPCSTSCSAQGDCGPDQYCMTPSGSCGGQGMCVDKPLACIQVYDPVCGCDDKTYSNSCYAAQAGVSVQHEGECPTPSCDDNSDCPNGFYCQKTTGECDGEGQCVAKPDLCVQIFDPVCGCDGITYSNSCFAAQEGVNIAHSGPCNMSCMDNSECPESFYCKSTTGNCSGPFECQPRPDVCPQVYDPVCGCDNNTYSNSCFAAQAGVNVQSTGPCPQSCTENGDCPPGFYCQSEDGNCGNNSSCVPIPDLCTQQYAPVCGCDGQTYTNACYAAQAGVSINFQGMCSTNCTTNPNCNPTGGSDFYCKTQIGDCGGDGVCTPVPTQPCPQSFVPVCGCDGVTYDGECEAAIAGTSVAHYGACNQQIDCGPNGECPEGYYCHTSQGDCNGTSECVLIPEACPQIFDPVCGCDGNTYSNACYAAQAGINVDYQGPCVN